MTIVRPEPRLSYRRADVADPRMPAQAVQIVSAAGKAGIGCVDLSWGHGDDPRADGSIGPPVESLGLKAGGDEDPFRLAACWIARMPFACPECLRVLAPTASGVYARHGECPGGGQVAVLAPFDPMRRPDWTYASGRFRRKGDRFATRVTGINAMKNLIKGI